MPASSWDFEHPNGVAAQPGGGGARRHLLTGSIYGTAQVGGSFYFRLGAIYASYPALSRVVFCYQDPSHDLKRIVDGAHLDTNSAYGAPGRTSWAATKIRGIGLVLEESTLTTEELTLTLDRLPQGGAWYGLGDCTVTAASPGLSAWLDLDYTIADHDRFSMRLDVIDYPTARQFRIDVLLEE